MNYAEMTIAELEERKKAIATEVDAQDADLDALEAEAKAINAELETRRLAEAKKEELRNKVAEGNGKEISNKVKEDRKMENEVKTVDEIRSSKEYLNAFVEYIKTNKDTECRKLLSENGSGSVPVPTYVEDRIHTAWEKLGVLALVRKTYVKGNLNVGFELSASAAAIHTEGDEEFAEETLTLGVVSLIPQSIKKWIRVSDEALDLSGEAFLDYIYDELTYRIAKFAQETLLAKIDALTGTASATQVSVGIVNGAPSQGIIASAIGTLSDEATNPVVVMNKGTWAQFKAAQYAGQFNADPFEGLTVIFDNSLPVYAQGITKAYAIVGDFGVGALANFPRGEEIGIKYDDLSEAQSDLVKFVGRMYVAMGIVADKAFCKLMA